MQGFLETGFRQLDAGRFQAVRARQCMSAVLFVRVLVRVTSKVGRQHRSEAARSERKSLQLTFRNECRLLPCPLKTFQQLISSWFMSC